MNHMREIVNQIEEMENGKKSEDVQIGAEEQIETREIDEVNEW